MNLFKRPWNLRLSHRVLIAACALVYLLLYRPWTGSVPGGPASYYAAAAAMLVLALLPPCYRPGSAWLPRRPSPSARRC